MDRRSDPVLTALLAVWLCVLVALMHFVRIAEEGGNSPINVVVQRLVG